MSDEQQQANPAPAPGEDSKGVSSVRRVSPSEFLARGIAEPNIDTYIDKVLADSAAQVASDGAGVPLTERGMLKVCIFLLHAIGHSMPYDAVRGLDAVRAKKVAGRPVEIVPSWRDCIGTVLGVRFGKPEATTAPTAQKTGGDDGAAEAE